jgi:predicted dienelactone hydrolase
MRSRYLPRFVPLVLVVLLLAACGDTADEPADTTLAVTTTEPADATLASTTTTLQATTTTLQATTTTLVAPTTTWVVDEVLPEAVAVGLAEPGEYGVGLREYTFVDPSRDDREVAFDVYYPAITGSDSDMVDAEPDRSGAPYPVIVSSGFTANLLGQHLASHGFVHIGAVGQKSGSDPGPEMIAFPLDLVTGLDGLEALDVSDPLMGLAATDNAGATGYSFDAWNTLMMAGASVDPDHHRDVCTTLPEGWNTTYQSTECDDLESWDAFVAYGTETGVATPEGLWHRIGGERIRAAMPMGPWGYAFVGPSSLEQIDVPTMYLVGGYDLLYPTDAIPLFESMNSDLASMITFTGTGHNMIFDPDAQIQFKRFALAFFGYHLAGIDEYAPALTPEFVERQAAYLEPHPSYETLVWGVHP